MGAVGGLLATFGGAALYRLDKVVPFVFGAIVMVVAIVCMWFVTRGEARES